MKQWILSLSDPHATLEKVGGKAASLAKLAQAGLNVPDGFYITTDAYQAFVMANRLQGRIVEILDAIDPTDAVTLRAAAGDIKRLFLAAPIPEAIETSVRSAYAELGENAPAVAVRSSATAEDLPDASFAGQQETFLNIHGAEHVLDAVRSCWASLWTARAIAYRARQSVGAEGVALAVVVQLLVPAETAGVLFTANPLNGRRDQMTITASWGLGESVVAGTVTPDHYVIRKNTVEVIDRELGDKAVQTIRVAAGIQQESVPLKMRRHYCLTNVQAEKLAQIGLQIESLYGTPMDIEWALAEGEWFILQARPITVLPEPDLDMPQHWKLPKGAYAAMRNNIVELMADPLSPLFGTLGLEAVNERMTDWMGNFLGDREILPDSPIITVNEYAYYNGSLRMRKIFKVLFNTRNILRMMFTRAVERWTEDGRPQYQALVAERTQSGWQKMGHIELLDSVKDLTGAAVDAYLSLVSGVIPAAWMSEGWFSFRYRFLKKKTDPRAPVFLMGFDSLPIRAEKNLYDLAIWASKDPLLKKYLLETPAGALQTALIGQDVPPGLIAENWQALRGRFHGHLEECGHMIYDLDFANPVPADDCRPVLETFKLFLSGEGTDPHQRQMLASRKREEAVKVIESRLRGRRLKVFRKNLMRAQKYSPLRESGLADVGLGYPLLRKMLLELGVRFTRAGVIKDPQQIFWLTAAEVRQAAEDLDAGRTSTSLTEQVPSRKERREAAGRATPPMMLPQMKVFGFDLMTLRTGEWRKRTDKLKGVGASPGKVTARACVVHGPEDFGNMQTGDVLVAPLTTPAWTPLFARASAVVTDIGGPLSHGSIVAREYGIPAVLGTGGATKTIVTGQQISVDGSTGIVTLPNGS